MTSSNGIIFRVTGPLCGEFTGRRWFPITKARVPRPSMKVWFSQFRWYHWITLNCMEAGWPLNILSVCSNILFKDFISITLCTILFINMNLGILCFLYTQVCSMKIFLVVYNIYAIMSWLFYSLQIQRYSMKLWIPHCMYQWFLKAPSKSMGLLKPYEIR